MQELVDAARKLLDRQPGLDPGAAMRRALQDDPALLARWHRGEADQAAPPPAPVESDLLVDPAVELMAHAAAAGITFTAACSALPHLARAWNAGELVAKSEITAVPATTLIRFRGAMGTVAGGNTIVGVEIFRPGTWNGNKYDSKALDDMVAAFDSVGYRAPVSMGHNAAEDALAHGFVSKLYRRGDVLMADLAGVPAETIQAIRDGRILSVSAEIYIGLKRGDRTFPYALRALSLLGAHPPGVDLRPIVESLPAAA